MDIYGKYIGIYNCTLKQFVKHIMFLQQVRARADTLPQDTLPQVTDRVRVRNRVSVRVRMGLLSIYFNFRKYYNI